MAYSLDSQQKVWILSKFGFRNKSKIWDLLRSSRATNLVVYDHRDLETAQKLLGHESSETTKIYVVKDDEKDAFEAFI